MDTPFNPNDHLIQLKNKQGAQEYLPVQWRLVWFREQCPQGTIQTKEILVDIDHEVEIETSIWNNTTRKSEKGIKRARGYARFKAIVTDGKGGSATGTKSENAANFPDYIEKAETGAIGRALAALGFGTQFAPDMDEEHRLVDSPVEQPQKNPSEPKADTQKGSEQEPKATSSVKAMPTEQRKTAPMESTIQEIQQELIALTKPYRTDEGKATPALHALQGLRLKEGLPSKQSIWTLTDYQQALTITKKWLSPVTVDQKTEVEQFEAFMGISFVQALSHRLTHRLPAELAIGPMEFLLRELQGALFLFELAVQVDIGTKGPWVHLKEQFHEPSLLNLIRVAPNNGTVDRADLELYQRYIVDEYHRKHTELSDLFIQRYGKQIDTLLKAA